MIPSRLYAGDKIGVVAPASPFNFNVFNRVLYKLVEMGFTPYVPETVFEKKRYLAGSDKIRAGEIHSLFGDKSVRAIICARGGYGSLRLLPLLDYHIMRENPKVFVGFSDATALLTAFYSRSGLVGFHGPMVTSLAFTPPNGGKAFLRAVASDKKIRLTTRRPAVLRRGKISGPVLGGNLATLTHLLGTDFAPDLDGHILILEEINEAPYRLDRMLVQIKLSGSFKNLAGLVLGSFKNCGKVGNIHEMIAEIFKKEKFPILAGFSFGHIGNNPTIPIGLGATLDTDLGSLTFHEAGTVAQRV